MGEKDRSRHRPGRSEVLQRPALVARLRRERQRLGDRLRLLREGRGWSQMEAAERLGVHPVQVARMEAGTANATLAVLVAAAVAFGIELRDLFVRISRRKGR